MLSLDGTLSKCGDYALGGGEEAPQRCYHAVDLAHPSVALVQGALSGGVVDVRRPERQESTGHSGDGQDLRQYLQGVYEGLPLAEDVQEPGWCLAEVKEGLGAYVDDVAPAVPAAAVGASPSVGTCPALMRSSPSWKNASAKMVACTVVGGPNGTRRGCMFCRRPLHDGRASSKDGLSAVSAESLRLARQYSGRKAARPTAPKTA